MILNSKCDQYYLAQNNSYQPLSNMLKQINFSFVLMVVEHGPWSTIWGFHEREDTFFWYLVGNRNYRQFILVPPKIWSSTTGLHGVTTQKTTVWIICCSEEGTYMPGKSFATEKNLV